MIPYHSSSAGALFPLFNCTAPFDGIVKYDWSRSKDGCKLYEDDVYTYAEWGSMAWWTRAWNCVVEWRDELRWGCALRQSCASNNFLHFFIVFVHRRSICNNNLSLHIGELYSSSIHIHRREIWYAKMASIRSLSHANIISHYIYGGGGRRDGDSEN